MATYPSSLPAPLVADYRIEVNFGAQSVTFERGNTRQRKIAKQERQVFNLSLILSLSQLWTWQSWINQYGYDFHYLNLLSNWSGTTSSTLIPHYVRVIGDIQIQAIDGSNVQVSYQVEMDLNTLPLGAFVPSGNWYVAGTPAAPASIYLLAGTPASPSTDFVIAGTPGIPAA